MDLNLNLALNPALEGIFGSDLFCFPGIVLDESPQLEENDPLEDLSFDHYPAKQTELPFGLDPTPIHQREQSDKVAIPRTRQIKTWSSRSRVSLACNPCRTTKVKCSGHRPVCDRCERLGVECNYGERRRQNTGKMVEELKSQIDELENLLSEIYPTLDARSAHLVDQSTVKLATHYPPKLSRATSSVTCNAPECPSATLGYTPEDFSIRRGIQTPGFIGEFPAVSWLNRLKITLEKDNIVPSSSQQDMEGQLFSSVDYYQNSSTMVIKEDVDILKRPHRVLADHLIRTYFRVVHPFFPIIGKMAFLNQYHLFYSDTTVRPRDQWLAVFNFICAIAYTHITPTQKATSCSEHPHTIHFSRGWMLSMDKTSLRHHENLQQVQIEGLAAFYLLSVGQVNRSWKCCHVAISSALAMGLNLRNESTATAQLSKEIRYRVWWSLYVLDNSLCGVTGHPMAFSGRFCTAPLPSPFEEKDFPTVSISEPTKDNMAQNYLQKELPEQSHPNTSIESRFDKRSEHSCSTTRTLCKDGTFSSSCTDHAPDSDSSFFYHITTLSTILRDVVEYIYAPSAVQREWAQIELRINSSLRKVEIWLLSLPLTYGLRDADGTRPLKRQSRRLALQLCYTKIMITQPCLRRHIPTSSEASSCLESTYDPIAEMCIENASQLLDLLPNEPNLPWLFGVCPCWSALHYIMQTICVFLTALILQSEFSNSSRIAMAERLVKALMWLRELSKVNDSAQKAWSITSDIIASHKAQLGFSSWPLPGALV